MRRRDPLMEWAAGLLLPVLIGLAGVLSYSALRTLALEHGYAPWEASLWPLVVDVFALVTMLTAMTSAGRHYGPSLEAWTLTAFSVGVTLLSNLLSAPPNLDPARVESRPLDGVPCRVPHCEGASKPVRGPPAGWPSKESGS